ncbi:MAG: hypothetical protein AAGC88_13425 [Bacteroidota bacterium]
MLTLATKDDKVWPIDRWLRMKFRDGLEVGSSVGHGPIRYQVGYYDPENPIIFQFQKPAGFAAVHKFEIYALDINQTQVKHTVDKQTTGISII